MISVRQKGGFNKLEAYLRNAAKKSKIKDLDKYGIAGVDALSSATPVDTGLTAGSWYYKIKEDKNGVSISFCNSNIQDGVPIAIILQYGHATGNGAWVQGRDYINPALRPVFDKMADDAWREVTK